MKCRAFKNYNNYFLKGKPSVINLGSIFYRFFILLNNSTTEAYI